MRPDRPSSSLEPATLTLLYTDMVGCSALLRELGPDADAVLGGQEHVLATAVEAAGGVVVDSVGDSMFAVFGSASRAVAAAVDAQRGLAAASWPRGASVAVRMGLNTGEPTYVHGRYFGSAVTRASNICEAAHGGQILLSLATRELVADAPPEGIDTRDLGEHPLGGRRERLFQVVAPGLESSFPAPRRVGHTTGVHPLPAGTITFLFTDIEDSTFLTRALGDAWPVAHADHRRLVRAAVDAAGGQEVDTQGDSFFFAFRRARDAVAAAIDAQTTLAAHPWPGNVPLRVRMGLHTGEPALGAEGYLGLDVVRGARVCAIADGGEVLLSETTHLLLLGEELPGARLERLGVRRLKGLNEDHHLFRLAIDGLPVDGRSGRTQVAALSRVLP